MSESTTAERISALFDDNAALSQFKEVIQLKNDELIAQFDAHKNVGHLLIEKSRFTDQLLTASWQHFLGSHAGTLSLVATGGYGRNELFPFSDIDIVILLPEQHNINLEVQDSLSSFVNFLWDIRLKPGYSVRTLTECIEAARDDQTIYTNMMEMRPVTGNEQLSHELKNIIYDQKIWPSEPFFKAKMEEQETRYSKFDDTAYKLEPNVKESPGGLRDMQVIAWVFKRHYQSSTLKELIKYGFIPDIEYEELITCRNILWRIRFALHVHTQRGEDRLLFDYQRSLAELFGYIDERGQPDVENFMQYYFKTVVIIEQLNDILLQLFSERYVADNNHHLPQPINDDFSIVNSYIEVKHNDVFKQNPLALLEIFLILQRNPSFKGIRATTIRLIRKSLHLIDDDFRQNPLANQLFIEILRQNHGITHQLRSMNRYGILAAYIKGFKNIVQRMQYDLFHIYTVDEHTLFLIRNLRRFSLDKHKDELPFCNNVFLLIPNQEVLYLAGLFHDIAKGLGGNHSVLGEQIAYDFCVQHEISNADTKLISWLVRHHLLMSTTAQKKDISDPDIIHEFASKVGNIKYLNHLYLLTVADIRATSPSLWNSWKDSLLRGLYISTHSALHRGLIKPLARPERLTESRKDAQDKLTRLGISQATVQRVWDKLKVDEYFMRYSPDEIAWHTIAISACAETDLPLVLIRSQSTHGSAEVFVYSKNEDMLFSTCTATLDDLGLSILDARIITTPDNYVLNSFQVLEQTGAAIDDLYRETHICNSLRSHLVHKTSRHYSNINKSSRQAKHFPIKTQISFLSGPTGRHTLLEVITTDRSGLLSTIGQAFVAQNIQLHDARITTIGSRVEDMFLITDEHSQPIVDEQRLSALKKMLQEFLNEDEDS